VTAVLASAWGLVVGALCLIGLGRVSRSTRVPPMAAVGAVSARFRSPRLRALVAPLRERRAARSAGRQNLRDLPMLVEVLGVAIAAGCTPLLALEQSRRWVPPGCGAPVDAVLRAYELGAAFPDALARGFGPVRAFAPLVDALAATDRLGIAVGPELERVAADCREAQRRVAEHRARSMSIRLLFPLVFLVLPAFGLLTVVPALFAGLHRL